MEAALAHVVRNKAEAAYARSDLFEKRCALLESWAGIHYEPSPAVRMNRAAGSAPLPHRRKGRRGTDRYTDSSVDRRMRGR